MAAVSQGDFYVCAVQMQIADGDADANHMALARILEEAPEADLYLVPELWTSGYARDRWGAMADEDAPRTMSWMAKRARTKEAWHAGSFIARNEQGSLVNRFAIFNREGQLAGTYDKAHLFRPMGEHLALAPGVHMPIFDVEGIKMAPAICYDLRFPEMFRKYALRGVDVFLVPSEWPHPRERALKTLASARAIENQAYVVLANRIGPCSMADVFCGQSGVFTPFGEEPILLDSHAGATRALIDLAALDEARRFLPVLEQRLAGIDYV